jgi:hypothetical protein
VQRVFALVERIRASGLTVLIVEQNVHQVLRVVDRAYLLEAGTIRASGPAAELAASGVIHEAYPARNRPSRVRGQTFDETYESNARVDGAMLSIFDVYFLEALLNGVLLGGVFALLALGLNLVFGVIDVVWICYAELIMLGMYGMYFLYVTYHVPFLAAAPICVAGVGILGMTLHIAVIQPLLGTPPMNQLVDLSVPISGLTESRRRAPRIRRLHARCTRAPTTRWPRGLQRII